MPFGDWLRGPLRDVLEDTLSVDSTRQRGLLDPAAVTAVRNEFLNDSGPWYKPWLLMMVELWSREVLDKSAEMKICSATSRSNCAAAAFGDDRT